MIDQAVIDVVMRELVIIERRTMKLNVDCCHTLNAIRVLRSHLGYGTDGNQGEVGDGKSPSHQGEDPSQPSLFSYAGSDEHAD